MDTAGPPRLLRFGVFEVDLRTGELRKAGRRIALQEQPFKVLVTLLRRPGEMLTREDLRNQVWPADTFVDFDTGLNKAIRKIREVLGDSADSPVFIETLPRRGYRFLPQVEAVLSDQNGASEPPVRKPPARVGGRRRMWLWAVPALAFVALVAWGYWVRTHTSPTFASIAVLPLENLSDNPDQEYFADGITDELITELAKVSSLRVISRTSVARYRRPRKPVSEIARELGASAIVEGTVLRAGNRVRVTAQLIDASRDQHIWAQSYEQSLGDVLTLQGRLARDIAAHVNARLTGSEQQRLTANRPVQPAAYEDYLKGRLFWNRRIEKDARQAIHYFEQAIEIEPDYADAYAGLADAYVVLGWDDAVMPPDEAFPKAKSAAVRALGMDRWSAVAHAALMWIELLFERNWAEAEKEAKEAIRLSPNSSMAHHHYSRLLAFTGRFDEALAESRKSLQLDPLDPIAGGGLAWNSYLARRYDQGVQYSLQMTELHPAMPGFYLFLGWCYEAQGRFREALEALQQARARNDSAWTIANQGYAYAASGSRQTALGTVEELTALGRQKYVPSYYIALVYAGLGENDQAFAWLEKAFREHSPDLVFLKTDPKLDPLRSDRRFSELVRRAGFPGAP